MSSLDIAVVQPCVQPRLGPLRLQTLVCSKAFPNPWKSSEAPRFVGLHHNPKRKLVIAAVATLEKCLIQKEHEQKNTKQFVGQSPLEGDKGTAGDDSEKLDEKEKLRRMRISQANRGNTPWNKGRKHSPETLQKIRERTKLAMQNPKIKMKLANLGHAQSEETKVKIGVGVRRGWEKRREKLMLQETCHFEWQNLIAEAARRGFNGEGELQWDSYRILDEQLTEEWIVSVERRKSIRPKGSKRAPKSAEQRRKIAEAIAAKWADPAYRERVCSGLAKYHGSPEGSERRARRKASTNAGSTKRNAVKSNVNSTKRSSPDGIEDSAYKFRIRRGNVAIYKDPLASSKLEMIKDIRAQRAAAESKKTESIEQARLLIVEAKKAAKALEIAATKSPVAQASLVESRRLIAEATQLIESIESGHVKTDESGTFSSLELGKDTNLGIREASAEELTRELTESHEFLFRVGADLDDKFCLGVKESNDKFLLPKSQLHVPESQNVFGEQVDQAKLNGSTIRLLEPNGSKIHRLDYVEDSELRKNQGLTGVHLHVEGKMEEASKHVFKKWVRGRLVEVSKGV